MHGAIIRATKPADGSLHATSTATTAAADCCSHAEASTCCEAEAKADCCHTSDTTTDLPTSCGCRG